MCKNIMVPFQVKLARDAFMMRFLEAVNDRSEECVLNFTPPNCSPLTVFHFFLQLLASTFLTGEWFNFAFQWATAHDCR